jgi:nitrogen fixation protein FixH
MIMNWGTKIAISFVIFGIIMGVMITISYNQEINLVAKDYYKQEIEYETQIEKMRNTAALKAKPELVYNSGQKTFGLIFPEELVPNFKQGEIHFFRPSDYKLDKKIRVMLNDQGEQFYDLSQFKTGVWLAKFSWESEDKAYYEEKKIVI